jgi:hypothetical protein
MRVDCSLGCYQMVVTYKAAASITIFIAAFFALSGPGAHIGPGEALLVSSALATAAIFLLIAKVSRRRATAVAGRRHHLALADAEGLMRMDTDKG